MMTLDTLKHELSTLFSDLHIISTFGFLKIDATSSIEDREKFGKNIERKYVDLLHTIDTLNDHFINFIFEDDKSICYKYIQDQANNHIEELSKWHLPSSLEIAVVNPFNDNVIYCDTWFECAKGYMMQTFSCLGIEYDDDTFEIENLIELKGNQSDSAYMKLNDTDVGRYLYCQNDLTGKYITLKLDYIRSIQQLKDRDHKKIQVNWSKAKNIQRRSTWSTVLNFLNEEQRAKFDEKYTQFR